MATSLLLLLFITCFSLLPSSYSYSSPFPPSASFLYELQSQCSLATSPDPPLQVPFSITVPSKIIFFKVFFCSFMWFWLWGFVFIPWYDWCLWFYHGFLLYANASSLVIDVVSIHECPRLKNKALVW